MIKLLLLGIAIIAGCVVGTTLLIYLLGLLKICIVNVFTKNTITYKRSEIMHHGSTMFLLILMGILVLVLCFIAGLICFGNSI
jgi:hypothetical protein